MSISMQAMWNLMHVMQVITYLRFIVEWPANTQTLLDSMYNAITMEEQINEFNEKYLFDIDFDIGTDQKDSEDIATLEKFDI